MISLDSVDLVLGGIRVLENVSFGVSKGEFVSLVGPSGAGKSSILKLIHLDLYPTSGAVTVMGLDTRSVSNSKKPYLRRMVGCIFQDYKLLAEKSAYENVAFALEVAGAKGRPVRLKTLQALHTVGMSHRLNHYPSEMSGGERQRVAIARAIVHEPSILLADEPTGNLDRDNALSIIALLERITHSGTIVLMATHKTEYGRKAGSPLFVRPDGSARLIRIAGGRLLGAPTRCKGDPSGCTGERPGRPNGELYASDE
jgi:cell division transport system ATP-binding protein